MKRWPARYELLDGLRGLAALAVVLHHEHVVEVGHAAVMVFFVISGYCICASARGCQRRGLGVREFLAKRLYRIYPPYVCALLVFAATRWLKGALDPTSQFHRNGLEWLQNVTLTQWVTLLFHPVSWPSQNPTLFVASFWSLDYEEQFYLLVAAALWLVLRFGVPLTRSFGVLVVLGFARNWLVPGAPVHGIFLEYVVHFGLGGALYYVLCEARDRHAGAWFLGVLASLALACAIRAWPDGIDGIERMRSMLELVFVTGVVATLYLLRPFSATLARSRGWPPLAALGTVSYSLYLIHQFNLHLVAVIATHLVPRGTPAAITAALHVPIHVLLAAAFWALCERPFQRGTALVGPTKNAQKTPPMSRIGTM